VRLMEREGGIIGQKILERVLACIVSDHLVDGVYSNFQLSADNFSHLFVRV
jgi:hypothetical protein